MGQQLCPSKKTKKFTEKFTKEFIEKFIKITQFKVYGIGHKKNFNKLFQKLLYARKNQIVLCIC